MTVMIDIEINHFLTRGGNCSFEEKGAQRRETRKCKETPGAASQKATKGARGQ